MCCVHHASELGFHPGGARASCQDFKPWSDTINGCLESTVAVDWVEWELGQGESARKQEPQETAISRRNNGSKAGDDSKVQM